MYVDDCLFFGRDKASVDNLIEEIKTIHSLKVLNPERSVFECLGIEVNVEGDEAELLQLGLAEKVLRTVGLDGCNPGLTPAKESPLTTDLDGEPFDEDWEYASVVGMLRGCSVAAAAKNGSCIERQAEN